MNLLRKEHIFERATTKNRADSTPEDFDIIMNLSKVGRMAWAFSLWEGYSDEEDALIMLERELNKPTPIEHPDDLHQNRFNPYW